MHHYNETALECIDRLRERVRELEEINASSELMIDVAWDELDRSRKRERRLMYIVLVFGTVLAIMEASWLAMWR